MDEALEVVAIGSLMVWLMGAFAIALICVSMLPGSKIEHPPWRQLPMFALGWPVYFLVAAWRRLTEKRAVKRLRSLEYQRRIRESS